MGNEAEGMAEAGRVAGESLALRVRMIDRVVTAIYDDAPRPHGLQASQSTLLVAIARVVEARPVAPCLALRIEKSTPSRDIEVMKRRGWIASDPPLGGRNPTLRLTGSGRDLPRAVLPAWERAQAEAHACLGPDGASQVRAVARRLGLDQLDPARTGRPTRFRNRSCIYNHDEGGGGWRTTGGGWW